MISNKEKIERILYFIVRELNYTAFWQIIQSAYYSQISEDKATKILSEVKQQLKGG